MRLRPFQLRLFFALCAIMGVAGVMLACAHRFVAVRMEAAIRDLSRAHATVASVSGNLLEGMVIRDLEIVSDVPGETRIQVRLPSVRVTYDLWSIVTGNRTLAPSGLEVEAPEVAIQRRGPKVELYKLVQVVQAIRQYLPDTPITVTRGKLELSGEFPWKGTETFAFDDGFVEWSAIGLSYRTSVDWRKQPVALRGSYDPTSGIGHLQWEAERRFSAESPVGVLASLSPTPLETASGWLADSRLTGLFTASGEVLTRAFSASSPDKVRRWYKIDLERIGEIELSWDASAGLDGGTLAPPGLASPLRVSGLKLAWPSGSDGNWKADVAALDGAVKLTGKLVWPLAQSTAFSAHFAELHLAALPGMAESLAGTIASGSVEAGREFPWSFHTQLEHLKLPQVPTECSADVEGTFAPAAVEIAGVTLRSGKAQASGQLSIDPSTMAFRLRSVLQGLPAEWLGVPTGLKGITGAGVRGTLEASGRLVPWSLDEGKFDAQAPALSVGGISAGDIRAQGRFSQGRIVLDTLMGVSKAQLFSSFKLAGAFEAGKPPELSGTVRGLRLDAFAPGVKGVAEADLKIDGEKHEVHAKVKGFAFPAADISLPSLSVELVPRGKAEVLQVDLPGKGKLEAAVVWTPGTRRSASAAGSFTLPDVSFLLAPHGFLRGGKAAGSFHAKFEPGQPPDVDFSLVELDLVTQRGPLVAQGPISGSFRGGRLIFSPASISLAGGVLAFEGVAGGADGNWDFKLDTKDLPVHFDGLAGSGALSGRLFSSFALSGALARPTVVANVRLEKPSLGGSLELAGKAAGSGLEHIRGKLAYRNGQLDIDRLVFLSGKQECVLSGQAPVTLALSPFAMAWGRGPMQLHLAFPQMPLTVASFLAPGLMPAADGTMQAEVTVSGTPSDPKVEGLLVATARKMSIASLSSPLTDVTAKLVFEGNHASLREFTAQLAGSPLTGSGQIIFRDGWKPDCDLSFDLPSLRISRKNLTMEEVHVTTRVRGGTAKLDLDSSFTVGKGTLDLAIFDGPSSDWFWDSIPESVSYHVAGATKGNFLIRSSAVSADLEGNLKLEGKGPTHKIGGELNAVRGEIHFQGYPFKVESGTITYRTPPANDAQLFPWQTANAPQKQPTSIPYITARGSQEIGRTTVYIELSGPAEHMSFALRSLPVHTEEEILTILATRTDNEPVAGAKDTVVSRMVTAPISAKFDDQFLNRPVGAAVRKATGLDEFRIDTNLLQSTDKPASITPQISAGKYLSKDLFVSVDGRVGTGEQKGTVDHLGLQYKLEKNLNFTLDKQLETKTPLNDDLSKYLKPEETKAGIEYKLRW